MRAIGWLVFAAMAACGASERIPEASPPPPRFGRLAYPLVEGQPLRFRFELPASRARLRVYASLTDTPGCSPAVPGVCVHLTYPQLLADVPVDVSGTTQVEAPWPAWLDGRAGVHVQATLTFPLTPPRAWAGPVWDDPILDAADDSDQDGLPAAQEHALSLRLDRADTDGGGSLDGQEVADGTRADVPGDDLRVESLCDNGLDDDVDGLLDCEDGDCTAGCVETDCADQVDDDFDGTTDCLDDDCWTRDCVDSTLAWTTHGNSDSFAYGTWVTVQQWAGTAEGKVLLFKGAAQRTCTWHGRLSMSSVWGHVHIFPMAGSYGYRVALEEGCGSVGSEILPPAAPSLWDRDGWYGIEERSTFTWRWTTWSLAHVYTAGNGGPLLPPIAYGSCPGGVTPTLAWPDIDGDGFGMTEAVDLHGARVDRSYFCGAVPAGFTEVPGDCDDQDASWSPALVVLDGGTACADLSPNDLDGDGVSPPTDPDDRDSRTWGQEVLCGDGADNDLDGLADCEDGDCAGGLGCSELACRDRYDNDGDGLTDCADEDCWGPSCNTSRVAWLMRGSLTGSWSQYWNPGPFVHIVADGLVGRVRTTGPQGAHTCTWTAGHALANYYTYAPWFPLGGPPEPILLVEREDFAVTPGCFVDEASIGLGFVPRDGPRPALGWYGPMDVVGTEANGRVRLLAAGPVLDGGADQCARGPAVRFYVDLDHDGFGVSDPTDRFGALGGLRYACGAVPAGGVTAGGDCDDLDPTWNPTAITRAPGAPCEAVRPDDRDGDGAVAGVDVDDLDGRVQ